MSFDDKISGGFGDDFLSHDDKCTYTCELHSVEYSRYIKSCDSSTAMSSLAGSCQQLCRTHLLLTAWWQPDDKTMILLWVSWQFHCWWITPTTHMWWVSSSARPPHVCTTITIDYRGRLTCDSRITARSQLLLAAGSSQIAVWGCPEGFS